MKKQEITLSILLAFGLGLGAGVTARDGKPPLSSQAPLTKGDVERMIASVSNWGRWGTDDQLGALNLVTPEKRKQAAALVQQGVSISLAREITPSHEGESTAFQQRMTSTGESPNSDHAAEVYSSEYHGSDVTHLDALCHMFYQGKMYNGFPQALVTKAGAARLSVVNLKNGFFTRAVLMDMPRLWGVKYLEGSKRIYPEDLEAWEKQTGVKVERGDAILIRTGRWPRLEVEGAAAIDKASAGLYASCLPWLKQREVAIVASDNNTDVYPSGIDGIDLPLHVGLINSMGVPILDNCDLEAVSDYAAEHRRWSFLMAAAPLAVRGGTGSPLNPVAIF